MTEIFFADISPLANSARIENLLCFLPKEIEKKIRGIQNKEQALRSLGAWSLLVGALCDKGIKGDFALEYNAHGKPFIKNRPDIHFSLSHSRNLVLCALSDCEVGCDIEYISEHNPRIAERYFNSGEAEFLKAIPDEKERQTALYRLWTLKESFLKNLGSGLSFPLKNFCITLEKNGASLNGAPQFENKFYFKEFFCFDKYCCSCCALSPDFKEITQVEL